MNKQTVINLDPIDRAKKVGIFGRLLMTRFYGGKSIKKSEPFGHYMFCGRQRSGKSVSCTWYAEKLAKRYRKKGFDVKVFSNIQIGLPVNRKNLFETINNFDPYQKEIRIVIIDEIQTYFPRDSKDKDTTKIVDDLISIFCQLGKRNTFILSTSQLYGRVNKSLREQCLFMINCKPTFNGKIKNEFIDGDDILCDELGRWSGKPSKIYIHGLQKVSYDTKLIITVD